MTFFGPDNNRGVGRLLLGVKYNFNLLAKAA